MAANKAKSQKRPVIDQPLNSKKSGDGFDAEADLRRSDQEREAFRKGANLSEHSANPTDPNDRSMIRGTNQESEHHKRRADG
jgi:hypothetical protein